MCDFGILRNISVLIFQSVVEFNSSIFNFIALGMFNETQYLLNIDFDDYDFKTVLVFAFPRTALFLFNIFGGMTVPLHSIDIYLVFYLEAYCAYF